MTTRDLVVSIDPAGKNLGVAVLDTKTMLVNAYTVDWTDDNGLHNLRFQDYAAMFAQCFLPQLAGVFDRAHTLVIEMPYTTPGNDMGYRLWIVASLAQFIAYQKGITVHYVSPSKIKRDFGVEADYRARKRVFTDWALRLFVLFREVNGDNKIPHGNFLSMRKKDDAADAMVNLVWWFIQRPAGSPDEAFALLQSSLQASQ